MSHITIIISKAQAREPGTENAIETQPAVLLTLDHDVVEDDLVETVRLAFRRLRE